MSTPGGTRMKVRPGFQRVSPGLGFPGAHAHIAGQTAVADNQTVRTTFGGFANVQIDMDMRQVLARMELLPGVGAAQPAGGGVPDSRAPSGDGRPMADFWRRRWLAAAVWDRPAVVAAAVSELQAFRVKDAKAVEVVPETEVELEARVVREGRGWSVREVALHCRVTETFVRKARLNAARAANAHALERIAEGRVRAVELAAQGLTERQIEMITKVPKSTLRRLIGKAA